MEKFLGQEIKNLEERKTFLLDNADEVEEKTYLKSFDADAMAERKERLAEVSIKINDLEDDIKSYKEAKKLDLKPLREAKTTLLHDIKFKGEVVTEKCFKFVDRDEGMVGFYNDEGLLIESRPATREESQTNIFSLTRKAVNE